MGLFSRRRDNVATTAPTGINNGYGPNDGVNTNSGHGINSGVHNNNGYGAHDGMNTNTHNRLGHNDSVNTDTRRGRKRLRRNTGEKRALFDMNSSHLNRRPSFGQWYSSTRLPGSGPKLTVLQAQDDMARPPHHGDHGRNWPRSL